MENEETMAQMREDDPSCVLSYSPWAKHLSAQRIEPWKEQKETKLGLCSLIQPLFLNVVIINYILHVCMSYMLYFLNVYNTKGFTIQKISSLKHSLYRNSTTMFGSFIRNGMKLVGYKFTMTY